MKKLGLFILIASAVLYGCTTATDANDSTNDDKTITLSGQVKNPTGQKIVLTTMTFPVADFKKLAEVEPDSLGNFEVTFNLDNPAEATFAYGQKRTAIFLQPGQNMQITFSSKKFNESISYAGEGAGLNNFLTQRYLSDKDERGTFNSVLMTKEPADFMAALSAIDDNTRELLMQADLSGMEKEYAETEILASKLIDYRAYPDYYYYHKEQEVELPENYDAFWENIDWPNDDMLEVSSSYRDLVFGYAEKLVKDDQGDDYESFSVAGLTSVMEAADQLTGLQKDWVSSKVITNLISYFGVDQAEEQMQTYLASNPKENWKENVNELYEKWKPLAKGSAAPDFEYQNLDGELISLASLKGKVVYVDVWATWCGPCKGEIPSAKEVKEDMKGKDVEFLYVSIDDDVDAWKKFLADDPAFANAIHIATYSGWKSDITEDYLIEGIPRYLLIDKEGKIISANAPRPSSKEIRPMIEEALKA
ncbi:MAG: TlpA family protein disulfide reductase [Saprospiraceae bacterium]|nr:TlpA family protein disulfide reductase [Saprospiraceae bacterium]